jgi:cell division protein FtsI/penicillin-binding protein 2
VNFIVAKQIQFRRLFVLGLLLSLALLGLIYRLVDLQVLRHQELLAKSVKSTQYEFRREARRGDILDVKGHPLATTLSVKTVYADPSLIGKRQAEVAHALAPLLETPESILLANLTPPPRVDEDGETSPSRYVRLKKRVSEETWARIQETMSTLKFADETNGMPRSEKVFLRDLRKKAIGAFTTQMRSYPNQMLAAHVVGYTRERERTGSIGGEEIYGADGIEAKFDEELAGIPGWRQTETDRRRRELVAWREQDFEPVDGRNVVLTIDSVIQQYAEEALAEAMAKYSPVSASAMVIRPKTGEILALANVPKFDPNNLNTSSEDDRRNRVIADFAEPGSTFKIVVLSGALNDGTVKLTDTFDCEHGRFLFANFPLKDHEAYDIMTAERIITKSSNIGAAKIGIKMGPQRLYDYIQAFGFGATTGIPLPGEVSAVNYVRPPKKWYKVSIAQIPMGQGICVTRLQMTMAMCAIANGGWLMRPMLVDRLEDSHHNMVKYSPQKVRRVISETAARQMVQALKTVVSPDGTGAKAALEHYQVAGKTGTAQKIENGKYVHDKFFSSFIGFFPADNPELCISVMLDDPDRKKGYYGGHTAAPVFKQIAERSANYLGIRPDLTDPSSLPENVTPLSDPRNLKTAARSP